MVNLEEITSRLRKAIAYLKGEGLIKFDKDVATAIGADKNTISQALKGNKDYLTPSLIGRICDEYGALSYPWIVFGAGEMLKSDNEKEPAQTGNIIQMEFDFNKWIDVAEKNANSLQELISIHGGAVRSNDKLIESNTKLIDQLITSLARIEKKIDDREGVVPESGDVLRTGRE